MLNETEFRSYTRLRVKPSSRFTLRPGLASIQAAAHPAQTNYLYFVVKPCGNGEQVFTSNYNQFLADAQKYQQARNAHGGKSPERCS